MAKRQEHVFIGMPSGDTIMGSTAMCLVNSVLHINQSGYRVTWINQQGTLVSWNQDSLSQMALDEGADYLWLVDSDMFWAKEVPLDLLRRMDAGKHIVGCNYRTRKDPRVFTAKHLPGGGRSPEGIEDPQGTFSGTWDTGCKEVDFMGTGMVMIRRKVLEGMPRPRFWTDDTPPDLIGNDANFMRAARAAGFKSYCDFVASRKVAHLGNFVLGWELGWVPAPASMYTLPGQ